MVKIKVKFIGFIRQFFGPEIELSIQEEATIKQVIDKIVNEKHSDFMIKKKKEDLIRSLFGSRILVNGNYADLTYKVKDKDVITLITMAGGG